MGYIVVHSTSHGVSEEGKDVIALNPKGKPVAFQLKQGNITPSEWRKIHPQIVELVEYPIQHPSITATDRHQAVLVTNGFIHENASQRIAGYNDTCARRGFNPLQVWAGSRLLTEFKKHTGSFLPEPLTDMHRLLGFMITDGSSTLSKKEFDLLLKSVLPVCDDIGKYSDAKLTEAVAASAITAEYALGSFGRDGNHFAKVEAYTMLACYIGVLAARIRVSRPRWWSTVEIIETALDGLVEQIFEDAKNPKQSRRYDPFAEPFVKPFRNPLVAGVLSSHGLWCMLGGKSYWYEKAKDEVRETVLRFAKGCAVPAEGFVPPLFLASLYLRHNGEIAAADSGFRELLSVCVNRERTLGGEHALGSAYLPLEDAVMRVLGENEWREHEEGWEETSVVGWPLILIAARRLLRKELEHLWYRITSLRFGEACPHKQYQRLLWRIQGGDFVEKMVPRPMTWANLCEEAGKAPLLPPFLKAHPHWLPYYLLVYPHRFNPSAVLALDDAVGSVRRNPQGT